jgi:putative membrane-bound dehydrogenase-like protein
MLRVISFATLSISALISFLSAQTATEPFNTEKSTSLPLSAAEAASNWKLPPGFQATVFAAEPEVRQPIAICTDDRGRLWVAESFMYAGSIGGYFEGKLRDRIIILEDTDNDGVHDKRTVFADGLERLTSIEVGLGGVWALTLPNLIFIPDKNRDDIPDGPAAPLIDGFDIKKSGHTMANGLRWGPDGWLYGRQGILGHSLLGTPGSAPESRVKMNVGIWRYHPTRRTVEVVAEGTTNPWGMDWDENGELFFINTVIGHLWHVIPGAHYKRMFGDDYNPHIFAQIDQHADHVHWDTTEKWSEIREGMSAESSSAGGGHAHTGLMIYLGDNWPDDYRNDLFTINFHGRRLNRENLEPSGSGFIGRHRDDIAFSADPWFRGIDLLYGPDGGVFVADWSDTGECHDDDGIHRQSGRIYKITHGTPTAPSVNDIAALSTGSLLPLLSHKNEWFARRARLSLQERAATGENMDTIITALRTQLGEGSTTPLKLRALWSLYSIGKTDTLLLTDLLSHSEPALRIWAVRLLLDAKNSSTVEDAVIQALTNMAKSETSPAVRLALASALQRIPLDHRAEIAKPLLNHAEDAEDHNLPLMLWYGIEPLASAHRNSLANLAKETSIPLIREHIARRLALDPQDPERAFDSLIQHTVTAPDHWTLDVLSGLTKALEGVSSPRPPASWEQLSEITAKSSNSGITAYHRSLGSLFRDPVAIAATRAFAADKNAPMDARINSLRTLTTIRDPGSIDLAKSLLGSKGLHQFAVERLSIEDNPSVAILLLERIPSLNQTDKTVVVDSLICRPAWAALLIGDISSGKLPADSLSPYQVRQIRSLNLPELADQITRLWGKRKDSSKEKIHAANVWKLYLTPKTLSQADKKKGKELYGQYCGTCHKMYGEGGTVGPELTGGGRDNLDYLLANILDPSEVVAKENQLSIITMKDGRSLSGMIRTNDERTTTLQTLAEKITLPTPDIAKIETLPSSLMPEGLIDSLPREQVRDLIAWLMDKG